MKTAVILSARREKHSDIPYPLLPFVDGVCLIDRTISILEQLGYEKIIIVVGYRAELFEKYRSEKIVLVKNENYRYTASMDSLALARPFITEDFLLIEGDTFYEAKVLETLTAIPAGNCFAVTEESGSGDEAFVEIKRDFITKISKDKHQFKEFSGELLGICRLSFETYRQMVASWNVSNNSLMNYEYMMMDCTNVLERPCEIFTNLIWGDVDDDKDFQRLQQSTYPRLRRKENPFDRENIIEHVTTIFDDESIREKIEICQIGGMSNKNFQINIADKSYVLRIPGIGVSGMVERNFEEQNSLLACKMGINPEIRYFNSDTGIKLADYVKGAETLNSATIQHDKNIRKIAWIYRTLHHSKVRFNNDFNVFHEILNYERLLQTANGTMYDGYAEVREKVLQLEDILNGLGIQLVPCHNDAIAENFIKAQDGTIYLIDWEYSGMNDPMWEFAALFLESEFSEDNQDLFLDLYYNGNIPSVAKEKIFIYQILMDFLWSLWTVIKEAQGDDFGVYGVARFNRGMKNLQVYYEGNQ